MWRAKGYRVTSLLDPAYPRYLAGVHEAPAVLFSVGDVSPADTGVSVVSGLAGGVDGAAHAAAVAAGGVPVSPS